MADNIYDLIMSASEPSAQEKAARMAQMLRREQTAGQLMQMHPLLRQMGSSILQGSNQGQNRLAGAADTRFGGQLRTNLQDDQQAFMGGENDKDRAERARQGALNRGLQRALAAERAKREAEKGPKPLDFKDVSSFRKEFNDLPEVKAYKNVSAAFGKIQKAANSPSAAGDLSLIFGFMKALDPGSTVREGEFANAQNAAGVPTQIANVYNRAASGERLSPEQRADFLKQARDLFSVHQGQYQQAQKFYGDIASRRGIDPHEVFSDTTVTMPAAQSMPSGPIDAAPTRPAQLSPEDQAALDWAKANQNDPRAKEILAANGM